MSDDEKTIWKRRALLMGVVALIVAIPATIILRDEEESPRERGERAQRGDEPPAPPEVGDRRFNDKLGVAVRLPKEWESNSEQEVKEGGVLKIRSTERDAAVAISAPGPAKQSDRIYREAMKGLEKEYRKVRVLDRLKKRRVGGLRSRSAVIQAKQPEGGASLRILLSVGKGERKSYLVEVFTSAADGGDALVEAQALLNTLELEG